jgi:hypothetical protein
VQQNNDETGKPFDKHCITVICCFRKKKIFIFQGGREVLGRTGCPQSFKWVLEHREL